MSDKPIIFNDAMVRAILDGRKTQTRRAMKPMSKRTGGAYTGWVLTEWRSDCPYGRPGDLLWVREAWCPVVDPWTGGAAAGIGHRSDMDFHAITDPVGKFQDGWTCFNWEKPDAWKFRPSIHMPRWASRITLEITDVRVERLQDITESDAAAEGCDNSDTEAARECGWYKKPRRAFRRVWEQINGSGAWDQNPWVWVIEFRPHLINIDQFLSQRGVA